ncbi:hypothetical protein LSAT2_016245 [Lamellibrachia satsuma]|nr:hypothetical protein LSAT2_016245 [Lamellibrachia satsuma]
MAFFNLTHLGYRNAIYEHVKDPVDTPHHIYHSGLYRTPEQIRLPPINRKEGLPEASLLPTDQTSGFGPGPAGSHEEYMRQRTKHIRNPAEPKDQYIYPVTTAQEIALWRKDEPIQQKEPWTKCYRYVLVASEMTKFVDEMALTNRQFSLF